MIECPECGGEIVLLPTNDLSPFWAECLECDWESQDFSSRKQLIEFLQQDQED